MRRTLEIGLDVLGFAGLGAVLYGTWLIYQPAAYLLGGAVAIGSALVLPRYLS